MNSFRKSTKAITLANIVRKRAGTKVARGATSSMTFSSTSVSKLFQQARYGSQLAIEKNEITHSKSDLTLRYDQMKKITLKFLSVWSDMNKVIIGDIASLDEDKVSCEMSNMSVYPKEFSTLLPTLDPSKAVKDFPWDSPFDPKDPVEITFYTSVNVRYIRILNSGILKEAAVRELEVYENETLAWKGETNRDFGIVALLNASPIEKVALELNPNLQRYEVLYHDNHGLVPQFNGNTITIKLLSNYGNPTRSSISHFLFFDTDEKPIPKEAFLLPPGFGIGLFDDPRQFQSSENQIIFNDIDRKTPEINVTVTKLVAIGGICIYNSSVPDLPIDQCAKIFQILLDNKCIYIGKLPQSEGLIHTQKTAMTRVFFSDMNKNLKLVA